MDLVVYNKNFEAIGLIDTYESLIWTDRLFLAGDFEIVMPPSEKTFQLIQKGYYIWNSEDYVDINGTEYYRLMMVEGLELSADTENGTKLIITGRSLESLLERRIVWTMTDLNGYLDGQMKKIFDKNITGSRKLFDGLVYVTTSDPVISSKQITAQYTGDSLYDVFCNACAENQIGFRLMWDGSSTFIIQLYAGKDRSYNQTTNPYVCFAPQFENIINSNYKEDDGSCKNIALIGGEGEGNQRTYATYYSTEFEPTGIARRELFVDARDLSSRSYNEQGQAITLTPAEYQAVLVQRGAEKLVENKPIKEFESEIDATEQYVLGRDFNIGDYVQIVNEYGIEGKALITEIVRSQDNAGSSTYPAFVIVE